MNGNTKGRRGCRSSILVSIPILLLAAVTSVADPFDVENPPEGRFWDEWMEVMLAGQKIGYARTSMVRTGEFVDVREEMTLRVARHVGAVSVEVVRTGTETLSGAPVSFRTESSMGQLPLVLEGEIANDELTVYIRQAGNVQERRFPWTSGGIMTWGSVRESLLRGFETGVEYTLPLFNPDLRLDGTTQTTVSVLEKEMVRVRGIAREAIRVQTRIEVPLGSLDSISWLDDAGRALITKMDFGGLDITLLSADESTALSDFVPPDVFDSSLLSANRAIPPNAESVTYGITFSRNDRDSSLWPETSQQEVIKTSQEGIVIRVSRGDHAENPKPSQESASAGKDLSPYLAGNSAINSDDEKLIALGREALGKNLVAAESPFIAADRLRRFATEYISEKNLDVGFATASEVARHPVGDCTEHSVFLAALARVSGIPSRVAVGLAYVPEYADRKDVFGVHMWTQMFLRGRWVDLDASLGETECAPTRIAFLTGSLDDGRPVDMMLPMMKLIGQIEVRIVSVEL